MLDNMVDHVQDWDKLAAETAFFKVRQAVAPRCKAWGASPRNCGVFLAGGGPAAATCSGHDDGGPVPAGAGALCSKDDD